MGKPVIIINLMSEIASPVIVNEDQENKPIEKTIGGSQPHKKFKAEDAITEDSTVEKPDISEKPQEANGKQEEIKTDNNEGGDIACNDQVIENENRDDKNKESEENNENDTKEKNDGQQDNQEDNKDKE